MALTLQEAPNSIESLRANIQRLAVGEVQNGQRNAMQELLEEREDRLQVMQTKSDQIQAFGEERWHNELVKLSDIEDPELQSFLWKKTPKLWRSFQEAFSAPSDIIVPKMELGKGQPHYSHYVSRLSVQACLADPDRVPDKLLIMLGLLDENADYADDFERLDAKYASLSSLKMMWESTGMLDPRYVRVMVVQKTNASARRRYPEALDVSDEAIGNILITREHEENGNGKTPKKDRPFLPRRLVVNPYESVYAARRSTGHVARQYEGDETSVLVALETSIAILNERFDSEWKPETSAADKDALHREALELIARSEELLNQCRQHHKRRAYDMLTGLKLTLERRQIGGAMSKMVGAVNALDGRATDIKEKSKHNAGARSDLHTLIRRNEEALRRHRLSVESNIGIVGTDLDAYTDSLTENARRRHVRMVMRPLHVPEILFKQPQVRPHLTYSNALRAEEDALTAALYKGDKDSAKLAGVRMHVIGKLQAANICIEELKESLSDPRQRSMTKIRTYIVTLDHIFQERAVFPDVEPMDFAAMYEPLEADIARLHEIVREAGPNIEEDPEVFDQYCKELMQFLDTMDVEAVMRELQQKIASEV